MTKLEIRPGFLFLCGMGLLFCGADTALCAFIAAFCHELGHYLASLCFGGRLERLTFNWRGLEMRVSYPGITDYFCDGFCALAGPGVNLLLGFGTAFSAVSELCFTFAGTNILLGLYNLLPLTGLDGGVIADSVLKSFLGYSAAEKACRVLEISVSASLIIAGIWLGAKSGNFSLLLFAFALAFGGVKKRFAVEKRVKP